MSTLGPDDLNGFMDSRRKTPVHRTRSRPTTPASQSERHTPEILERHGITYIDKIVEVGDLTCLPFHVRMVRDGLLNFEGFLFEDLTTKTLCKTIHTSEDIPVSAYRESRELNKRERQMLISLVEMASTLTDRVLKMKLELSEEAIFHNCLNETVFSEWNELQPRRESIPNISDVKDLACISTGKTHWTEAHSRRGLDKKDEPPPHPVPDFYFGFPVYDTPNAFTTGFGQSNFIQNFTAETLFHLRNYNLGSIPAAGFATEFKARAAKNAKAPHKERDIIKPNYLLCFPWAVVEIKGFQKYKSKIQSATIVAYCQSANASSAALCMMENLARFAKTKKAHQHVPPIVSITCVGNMTKLWIMYSCPTEVGRRNHKMRCIWEGDLCKIWDSIQFCRILEHLSSWGRYIVRPVVSQYIDQWRSHYPVAAPGSIVQIQEHQSISAFAHHDKEQLNSFLPDSIDFSTVLELMETLKEAITSKLKSIPGKPAGRPRLVSDPAVTGPSPSIKLWAEGGDKDANLLLEVNPLDEHASTQSWADHSSQHDATDTPSNKPHGSAGSFPYHRPISSIADHGPLAEIGAGTANSSSGFTAVAMEEEAESKVKAAGLGKRASLNGFPADSLETVPRRERSVSFQDSGVMNDHDGSEVSSHLVSRLLFRSSRDPHMSRSEGAFPAIDAKVVSAGSAMQSPAGQLDSGASSLPVSHLKFGQQMEVDSCPFPRMDSVQTQSGSVVRQNTARKSSGNVNLGHVTTSNSMTYADVDRPDAGASTSTAPSSISLGLGSQVEGSKPVDSVALNAALRLLHISGDEHLGRREGHAMDLPADKYKGAVIEDLNQRALLQTSE